MACSVPADGGNAGVLRYAQKHLFDEIDTIDILTATAATTAIRLRPTSTRDQSAGVSAPGSYWENGHPRRSRR